MAKKNEIAKIDSAQVRSLENIDTLIYVIRGKQVMLDRDLAKLYGVDVSQLNRQVKRNIERFPDDFMFQLSKDEYDSLKCQNGISSWGGNRYMPYAFTEQGVAMLSGLLRSPIAIATNIRIMRAFVAMRQTIAALATTETKIELLNEKVERLNLYIDEVLRDQNDINEETQMQLELINQSLAELQAKPKDKPRRRIGFESSGDE